MAAAAAAGRTYTPPPAPAATDGTTGPAATDVGAGVGPGVSLGDGVLEWVQEEVPSTYISPT